MGIHLYQKYGCHADPMPEPLQRMFKHYNSEVGDTMLGSKPFVAEGTARNWDRWDDLKDIRIPTLLIGGRFDFVRPEDFQKMGALILGHAL